MHNVHTLFMNAGEFSWSLVRLWSYSQVILLYVLSQLIIFYTVHRLLCGLPATLLFTDAVGKSPERAQLQESCACFTALKTMVGQWHTVYYGHYNMCLQSDKSLLLPVSLTLHIAKVSMTPALVATLMACLQSFADSSALGDICCSSLLFHASLLASLACMCRVWWLFCSLH